MKIIKILTLGTIFLGILLMPTFVFASNASSESYKLTDQIDFGGGASNSENYEVFGFLTDESQIVFWPRVETAEGASSEEPSGGVPISTGPITELETLIPTEGVVETLEDVLSLKVFGNLGLGDIAKELNFPLAATGAVLTLGIMLLSQLFGGVALLSPIANLWSWFLSLFGFGKKKGRWGVVYDSEAKIPITMAVVQIFDQEYNKLLATKTTDQEGRFSFFVKPGRYYIKVIKSNYIFPSKFTTEGYHGAPFEVLKNQEIVYRIPVDPVHKVLVRRVNILSDIIKTLNVIRIPVLIIGTIFAAISLYIDRTTINLIIACVYVLIWMVELYKLRKSRPYGLTKDKINHELLERVILRLFDEKNKLVSTQVSNKNGKFNFLTNPGEYQLTAVKEDYEQFQSRELSFSKSGRINLDVLMDRKKPKIRITPTVFEPEINEKPIGEQRNSMHPSWA